MTLYVRSVDRAGNASTNATTHSTSTNGCASRRSAFAHARLSVARGGDWIDKNVAGVLGCPVGTLCTELAKLKHSALPHANTMLTQINAEGGGNVTLFAFDKGEGLSEHTAAFDALVIGANCTMDGVHFAIGEGGRIAVGDFCYFTNAVLLCELELQIGNYVVIGWNDLGMHCYNHDFQDLAVLPPYNTLWAQVIQRGDPPPKRCGMTRSSMASPASPACSSSSTTSMAEPMSSSDFGETWRKGNSTSAHSA